MPHRRRRRTLMLVAVPVLVLLGVGAALRAFAFPSIDRPAATDVIVVLGPANEFKLQKARSMIAAGHSDTLLITAAPAGGPPARPTACDEPVAYTVYCNTPDPSTTQGEAQALGELAVEKHWSSATVVTIEPHATRARVLFSRCFEGELRVVSDQAPSSLTAQAYQYTYESAAFIKVALNQGC